MSFLRHPEIFPSDGGASFAANASAHRVDEFPAGYSLAGCSPAGPAFASPAIRSVQSLSLAGNRKPANRNPSLIPLSQSRGAVQSVPVFLPVLLMAIFQSANVGCQVADHQAVSNGNEAIRLVLDTPGAHGLVSKQSGLASTERREVQQYLSETRNLLITLEQSKRTADSDAARARLDYIAKRPELYIPERIGFLDAIARERGLEVPPKSYCRILERSEAVCSRTPGENPVYVEIRVTSGAMKGSVGWACLPGDIFLVGPEVP